jgi:hypothetical protein
LKEACALATDTNEMLERIAATEKLAIAFLSRKPTEISMWMNELRIDKKEMYRKNIRYNLRKPW